MATKKDLKKWETVGKVDTWDKKPLREETHNISVPVKWSNKMTLMLHIGVSEGEYRGKKFRVIQDAGMRAIRLEYDDRTLDIGMKELITKMMDKMVELNEGK